MFRLGRFVPGSTMTLKVQVLVLLDKSQATRFTMFVPSGKEEPVPGVTTRLLRPQLSVAEALKLTTTGQVPRLLVVMSAGQKTVGNCVSRTTTVNEQVAFGRTPLLAVTVTRLVPTGKLNGEVILAAPSL